MTAITKLVLWIVGYLIIYLRGSSSNNSHEREDSFYKQGFHPEFQYSDRIIKNAFFSMDEVKSVTSYMKLHPPQEVIPGWSLIMLNSILNNEYCQKENTSNQTSTNFNSNIQSNSFLRVLNKIKLYAESIANEPLAFFIVAFGKRGGNAITSRQSYLKLGSLNFSLAPHADSCQLESVDNNVFCLRKHSSIASFHTMMDYTALMYLNALKPNTGGEFLFLDLPKNATVTNEKSPADIRSIQDECTREKKSSSTASSSKCSYLERESTMIKITPAPGKMILFESGPTNIHAVLDHTTTENRKILTIYLTKLSKIDMKNFPKNDMSAFPYSFQVCDTRPTSPTEPSHFRGRRSTLDAYQQYLTNLVY